MMMMNMFSVVLHGLHHMVMHFLNMMMSFLVVFFLVFHGANLGFGG
jgi:hypothetical protein